MANLLVENVDLSLLEKQRLSLVVLLALLDNTPCTEETRKHIEEVEGLRNMLDYWSDNIFVPVRVRVKEWFDKANGNSYFSARLWIEDCLVVVLQLQYGYDDHGVSEAVKALAAYPEYPSMKQGQGYWRYCEENQMKLDYSKETGCLKRDVKAFGERE